MCKYCGPVIQIYDENFNDFIESTMAIVLYTHDKCRLGKTMLKVLRKIEYHYPTFLMTHYNLSKGIEYALKYSICATPSLLLFQHGVLTDRVSGFLSEEELLELLNTWQQKEQRITTYGSSN